MASKVCSLIKWSKPYKQYMFRKKTYVIWIRRFQRFISTKVSENTLHDKNTFPCKYYMQYLLDTLLG